MGSSGLHTVTSTVCLVASDDRSFQPSNMEHQHAYSVYVKIIKQLYLIIS